MKSGGGWGAVLCVCRVSFSLYAIYINPGCCISPLAAWPATASISDSSVTAVADDPVLDPENLTDPTVLPFYL